MIERAVLVGASGSVSVEAGPRGIRRIILEGEVAPGDPARPAPGARSPASSALNAWFSGDPAPLTALGADEEVFERASAFNAAVWREAMRIPWGETRTYGGLAAALGRRCARAVGRALGANPLPLLVPCHRVVRSDGGTGGFSAGKGWKDFLLHLERKTVSMRSDTT